MSGLRPGPGIARANGIRGMRERAAAAAAGFAVRPGEAAGTLVEVTW
ncbi:hypothetical protein AB1285_20280 [Microbacterium sp. NRRL B-14842]